ncbi:hypothetical protein [Cupriavidus malaysiensis]|uniref:Phage tail protein n=1 Tax=Cupriavidus malaysiensis TaxID=367825 RepID=A0ABN4THT1_9BURK|nr:hypothetical protein [Cupriavidus malaysiensis]AOZ06767.1 hypothetical protein BKK80_13775 [Cupriavidus malaysiensis]
MNYLTKEQILSASDIKTVDVPVPEWGGVVRVAMMSGLARDALVAGQGAGTLSHSEFAAHLLVATVVDASGDPLFTSDAVESLRIKSDVALRRVVSAAVKLNGLGPQAVEEAEKNSEAAQSGASGSASPSSSAAP